MTDVDTAIAIAKQYARATCISRRCHEHYDDLIGAALIAYVEMGADAPEAWVARVMQLRIIDEWRRLTGYRKRSHTWPTLVTLDDIHPAATDDYARVDDIDEARQRLRAIPRDRFVDAFLADPYLTPRQMAARDGVSPSAISHRLAKLRKAVA